MRKRVRACLVCIIVGIATCALLYCLAQLIPVSHVATSPGAVRYRHAVWVGNALRRYEIEHEGRLPDRLSELVPKFVAVSNIDWFFWPPASAPKKKDTSDLEEIQRRIDRAGAFVYLGSNGVAADLILYERPDLWITNTSETRLTTLTTNDFLPKFRSASFVQERLRSIRK
jgi:hypothetical protein